METSSLCRICLAEGVRMHSIVAGELQELYEILSRMPLETKDNRPTQACYMCFTRLKNCYQLRQSCVQSEELLTEMLSSHVWNPAKLLEYSSSKKLQIRPVKHMSLEHVAQHEADSYIGMNYAYEVYPKVKLEPVDTEVFEEDQLVQELVYSEDTVEVLVKKEPSEFTVGVDIPIKTEPAMQMNAQESSYNTREHTEINVERLGGYSNTEVVIDEKFLEGSEVVHANSTDIGFDIPIKTEPAMQMNAQESSYNTRDHTEINVERLGGYSNTEVIIDEKFLEGSEVVHANSTHIGVDIPIKTEPVMQMNVQESSYNTREHTEIIVEGLEGYCKTENITDDKFLNSSVVVNANSTHTGKKPHQCGECKQYFSKKIDLSTHICTHTGTKYPCHVCHKSFYRNCELKRHMLIHTGEKPYQCHICNKSCSRKDGLRNHMRIHNAEKARCNVCKKWFPDENQLDIHICSEPVEKTYQCDVCKKCFLRKDHLSTHRRTHTGEKPFQCYICKKCFNQKAHLNSHVRTHQKPRVEILKSEYDEKPSYD